MGKNKNTITRGELNELNNVMSLINLKGLETKIFMPWMKIKINISEANKTTQAILNDLRESFGIEENTKIEPGSDLEINVHTKLIEVNKDSISIDIDKVLSSVDFEKLMENNSELTTGHFEVILKWLVKA